MGLRIAVDKPRADNYGIRCHMEMRVEALRIDPYIIDPLMRDLVGHDRQPSAYLVYLWLWHAVARESGRAVQVPLAEIAEGTGLSKRGVQDAIGRLMKRQLVSVSRENITAVPYYTVLSPWVR
jgi:CRP-like cAMP-binding protein